jgi:phenylalanyl-tRNA synthetase alpha chain
LSLLEELNVKIEEIKGNFDVALAKVSDVKELGELKVEFMGKKGSLTSLFKSMGKIPNENKKEAGQLVNKIKVHIDGSIKSLDQEFVQKILNEKLDKESVDVTLPGNGAASGSIHPIYQTERKIVNIFSELGFQVAMGPEIENEFCNFEALNIQKWHPARDMQDTFFFSEDVVLRTHTSPVQTRTMLKYEPPIKIIAPGKTFRFDEVDASHSPVFQQIEGLMVDEGVSFTDFKGVMKLFLEKLFGEGTKVVFRPSYFPFVEPGVEVDVSCPICNGGGCSVCKGTGYMEIMGAGMVNPKVFDNVGIDSKKYSGFAFGLGLERITMVLHGVSDIRYFYDNDIRFLKQFQSN